MSTGFAIFAHGSRIESANEAVRQVARDFARAGGHALVEAAFLELGRPDLEGAIARLVERGAERIVVIPYFLTLGIHLKRDLPRLVAEISSHNHQVRIDMAAPMDGHPGITEILLARAREVMNQDGDSTT